MGLSTCLTHESEAVVQHATDIQRTAPALHGRAACAFCGQKCSLSPCPTDDWANAISVNSVIGFMLCCKLRDRDSCAWPLIESSHRMPCSVAAHAIVHSTLLTYDNPSDGLCLRISRNAHVSKQSHHGNSTCKRLTVEVLLTAHLSILFR